MIGLTFLMNYPAAEHRGILLIKRVGNIITNEYMPCPSGPRVRAMIIELPSAKRRVRLCVKKVINVFFMNSPEFFIDLLLLRHFNITDCERGSLSLNSQKT